MSGAATDPDTFVLVVDDDPKIASMIGLGLRSRGFGVEIVGTGAEAIERVRGGGADVQLLDLGLPDMDGLDVLRTLRGDGVAIPVIVVTARSDPGDRQAAIDLGVDAYLTKPFDWPELWAAIEACMAAQPGRPSP
jgi:two-component system, OmpR family, KDP operon response regulator KdpE